MKILELNKAYAPLIGGIETVVKDTAEGLADRGVHVAVLVCQTGPEPAREKLNGVEIYRTATLFSFLGMPISLQYFVQLWHMAPAYDLIVIHHPFPLAFLAYLLCGRHRPVVVWYHADIVRQRFAKWFVYPIVRAVLLRAHTIIVSSIRMRDFSRWLSGLKSKCKIIYYGVQIPSNAQLAQARQSRDVLRKKYGSPLVLSVGRLVSYKGLEYLIKSFQQVNAHLLIIGRGPLGDQLRQLVKRFNLTHKVSIISPQPSLAPYYTAADLFVLPSVTSAEAFGIVQAEALSYGVPIINTNLRTSVPEVSIHKKTGLTVEPRDTLALSAAINRLLSSPDQLIHYSSAARHRAQKYFSHNKFIEQFTQCCKKVIDVNTDVDEVLNKI